MSKIFQCSFCDKTFANRHNVSRHKKAFYLRNIHSDMSSHGNIERGNGLIMDYAPTYHVTDRNKLQREADMADDEDTNSDETSEESNDMNATNAKDTNLEVESENNTDESDAYSSEDDHSVDELLWKQLAILLVAIRNPRHP